MPFFLQNIDDLTARPLVQTHFQVLHTPLSHIFRFIVCPFKCLNPLNQLAVSNDWSLTLEYHNFPYNCSSELFFSLQVIVILIKNHSFHHSYKQCCVSGSGRIRFFLAGSGSVFLDPDPDPPISVIFPIFLP